MSLSNRRNLLVLLTSIVALSIGSLAAAEELDISGRDLTKVRYDGGNGAMIEGPRCATVDQADPSIPRGPIDMDDWIRQYREERGKLAGPIDIPVWVHNIYRNTRNGTIGYVTNQMANDQIQVLNDAYGSLGYTFTMYGLDRYANNIYYSWDLGSPQEDLVKQVLAVYPQFVLNVYYITPPGGTLGWAYFPWSAPEDHYIHGVVALSESLPGGSAAPYDEGDTMTHEVGHWMGLYHTFQGGCFGNGDFVADTPPEATPTFGCPAGKDTCAGGGPDPIHNFMDYSDDFCMFEFTAGQNDRMDWAMANYRPLMGTVPKANFLPEHGNMHGIEDPLLVPDPVELFSQATPRSEIPSRYALRVEPNPFNPKTSIRYELPRAGFVSIRLFDAAGRRVARVFEGVQPAGNYALPFDGEGFASGVYHVVINGPQGQETQRLALVK